MSLVLPLCLFLFLNSFPLALAGPQYTNFLAPYLVKLVATCAQSCLEAFIATSFPTSTCPDPQDLDCLCTRESKTGFTLGEGALRCLASDCTNEQLLDIAAAYGVCASVPGAKPMTHSTITATMANPTTITFDTHNTLTTTDPNPSISSSCSDSWFSQTNLISLTSSVSSSKDTPISTSSITGILTASGTPPLIPTNTAAFFPINPGSSSTTSLPGISSTDTSAAAATQKSTLTNQQIAGIAVSAGAVTVAGFALLIFLFCFRNKRASKRDSGSSFGGDLILAANNGPPGSIPTSSRDVESGPAPKPTVPAKAQQFLGVPVSTNDRRWSLWRMRVEPHEIGVAVAPEMGRDITQETSPVSIASYRTTSRLLPDKPSYSLFPSPTQNPASQNPTQPPTVRFAGSGRNIPLPPYPSANLPRWHQQPMDTSQIASQGQSNTRRQPASDPFVDSTYDPRAVMYAMERKKASRAELPQIITPGNWQGSGNSWGNSSTARFLRPVVVSKSEGVPAISASPYKSIRKQPLSPTISSSVDSNDPPFSTLHQHASAQPQLYPASPYRAKSNTRRPVTHLTTASETSFEDEADEVDDGPVREFGLSPVVESPMRRTPSSMVRYPPLPGSSVRGPRPIPESPTRKPPSRIRQEPIYAVSPISPGTGRDKALPPRPGVIDRVELPERSTSPLQRHREAPNVEDRKRGPQDIRTGNNDVQKSAKWKILCSPGLEGLENVSSSSTMRHVRSNERPPNAWG